MKKLVFIAIAFAALALAGCEQEKFVGAPQDGVLTVLSAGREAGPATKSALTEDGDNYWSVGDKILVAWAGQNPETFTSKEKEPGETAKFQGFLPTNNSGDDTKYAIYPAEEGNVVNKDGSFDLKFHAEQDGVEGTYDPSAFLAVAQSSDNNLAFYNVLGLLRLNFVDADIRKVVLRPGATPDEEEEDEVIDEPEEVADTPKYEITSPKGYVSFEHINFCYEAEKPLYDDFNLEVKPGQLIAIVGPTGAGKTTLVNLLMRFYEIQSGVIRVDGVDIRDLSRKNLRDIFGMVLQDTWLFKGTVRENIMYGKDDVSEEAFRAAVEMARVEPFIHTLPDGYETVLDDGGSNLSAGQKQLLTIARAIISDPSILILDEATSSVDTRTEIQIQTAMNNLMHGRTNFVIAHRLSTIRNADCILVIENGRIVEQGTHDEMLQRGGAYAQLYNAQFGVGITE